MNTNILEFYVNKFNYFDNTDDIVLNNIPPVVRRRMSALDKITLLSLEKTFTNNIQNIVFSSRYGEIDRLKKMIEQYTKNNEVSPNTFSSSVHNYPVSFFLLNKQLSIPYMAISSYENSISSGLLVALVSNYDNVLFCYSDVNNSKANSMAINLSKIPNKKYNKYALKLQYNNNSEESLDNYIKLFSGNASSIKTNNYNIERLD